MQLSISNLAWETTDKKAVFRLLAEKQVQGIEIAPSKVWPQWQGITPQVIQRFRLDLKEHGFEIPALQAILFGYPDYRLFGTRQERQNLLKHLKFVAEMATDLEAKVMVLGAPRNRDRGDLSEKEAFKIAVEFFQEIGDYCATQNTCLCIEPNPPIYQCNFVTTSDEGKTLVHAVHSAGFGLHLDAAGMHLAGEAIPTTLPNHIADLRHFHISEPNLDGFSAPQVAHAEIGALLRENNYEKWVSIEMRSQLEVVKQIEIAVDFVRTCYFENSLM